jgi:hypothetical protein
MAKKHSTSCGDLTPGTLCLVRSKDSPQHTGKVVVVGRYDAHLDGYECSPELFDEEDYSIIWDRAALIPLDGNSGVDEMLRIVGKPEGVARKAAEGEAYHG